MKTPPNPVAHACTGGSYARHPSSIMRFILVHAVLAVLMLAGAATPLANSAPQALESPAFALHSESTNTTGWLASAGGSSSESINALLPLPNGGVIVAGSFEQNIDFNGDVIGFSTEGTAFGVDFFIGWIAANGTWTNTTNGSSNSGLDSGLDSISALAALSDGTVLVAGTYCDMTFGSGCNMTLGELDPISKTVDEHENAVFLAAMTPEGDWMWAKSYSNAHKISVVDLLVTQNDEIHLALLHRGELLFENETSLASENEEAVALVMMNGYGDHLAVKTVFSTNALDTTGKLCKDSNGGTYFITTFFDMVNFDETEILSTGNLDIAVAQYSTGGWNWIAHAGGSGDNTVADCTGRASNGIAIVGDYMENMSFGDMDIDDAVWIDFYEAHLSTNGEWLHASGFGGNGADRVVGIEITSQGDSIILGETSGALTLGEFTLTDLDGLNNGNHLDLFLAQRQENGAWDWAISGGGGGNDRPSDLALTASGSPVVAFASNNDGMYGPHVFDQRDQVDIGVWMYETDLDLDGVLDGVDNCPKLPNPNQENHDGDAFGDLCDEDDDNDGVNDASDDCNLGEVGWQANANTDHDGDGCRDATEDLDDDEDGIFDSNDLCPTGSVGWVSTEENDIESDGCADVDTDGDGFVDQADNCPGVANPTQGDLDNDNIGDPCDVDKDGDGISIPDDNCPNDLTPWISFSWNDYDTDGCIDETMDDDDDDDGVLDVDDTCLFGEKNWIDQAETMDHDGDGCADSTEDDDDDNDGIEDVVDRCPKGMIGVAQSGQDMDGDGCIDAVEDDDDDQDGVLDPVDLCPRTTAGDQISSNGCSEFQLDDDDDGVVNAYDFCLNSVFGAVVDEQGCATKSDGASGENDSGGFGLAGWLFLAAGVIGAWAVIISNQRVGPTLPKEDVAMAPPPRPSMLEQE